MAGRTDLGAVEVTKIVALTFSVGRENLHEGNSFFVARTKKKEPHFKNFSSHNPTPPRTERICGKRRP